ncbi:glycosyltransferase family 39 protein [Streptomyces sp. JJ36]|uniref:glycosyltransferase family 39 protein n=1 Tax=Streptomyces sp. JJ36 TaxID=2736645 RepID=UPI001F338AC9|nr:glycosyltransferase family 39 protein [Streptomyces sp. JJ36]MCF6522744.1 glycosyltransferase family 39 protein [Streptomyces sp. JJ36]
MPPSAEPPRARPAAAPPRPAAGVRRAVRPVAGGSPADAARTPHYWRWLLPVLVVLATLTRLPSFTRSLWNPDEGFLATQARQLAEGGVLYDTVVDRKPPLLPWLYQGAFALFGDESLWPLKAAAVAATVATALLLASFARRRWGDGAGWTAGVLVVLLSVGLNPEDTQAATFEVFMLPWTAAAVWCADRRRWAWAGLAVALAALTKQTGGAVLVPVLFLLFRSRAGGFALLRLLAAYALPIGAVALALEPGRFCYWIATGSGSYASVAGAELLAAARAAGSTAILTVAAAPLLVALVHVTRRLRRPLRATDVWVWLGSSGLAVAVGFQFYGHYFLQLVPPLALLGTAALTRLPPRPATAALGGTALLCAGFVTWGLTAERPELEHARKVSAALKRYTGPEDRVLVWGMHPEDYWLADREPASRYLTAGFLTNYSGGRGGVRTGQRHAMPGAWYHFRRDLAASEPEIVVDDSRGKPYRPERVPALRRYLTGHYERAGTVDGAVFWVRRD